MSNSSRLVVLAAALAFSTPVLADSSPVAVRNAARVTLSNGQVVEVLSTTTMRPDASVKTVFFVGELGKPVTVTEETDLGWMHTSVSVLDGKQRIEMRFFMGFVADGMGGPAEVRLGDKVYRWISQPTGEATAQKRAMQKAISALPEHVRKNLITFTTLCSAAGELVLPTSGFLIPELFAETIPQITSQSIKRLSPAEVAEHFPNQSGEFLSSSRSSKPDDGSRTPPSK